MKLGLRRRLDCASLAGCALLLTLLPVAPSALAADAVRSAPITYARTCDAYGAGYFTLPGTDVCLRAGGMVVEDLALRRLPRSAFTPNPGSRLPASLSKAPTPAAFGGGGGIRRHP